MSEHYEGTITDEAVDEVVRAYTALLAEAGEVGFILAYRAVDLPDTQGRSVLAGEISTAQARAVMDEALTRVEEAQR